MPGRGAVIPDGEVLVGMLKRKLNQEQEHIVWQLLLEALLLRH